MKFSEKLRQYRIDKGLTQDKLAKRVGLTRSKISELENGYTAATLKTIEKIATGTKTDVSWWLEDSEEININEFEGFKIVVKALRETGDIDKNGKANEYAKKMLLRIALKEAKLLVERSQIK